MSGRADTYATWVAPNCRGELPHPPHDSHWWMADKCKCPCHAAVPS